MADQTRPADGLPGRSLRLSEDWLATLVGLALLLLVLAGVVVKGMIP